MNRKRLLQTFGLSVMVATTLWGTAQNSVTYAISKDAINSIYNNTPFYDPNANACLGSKGTTVLVGADNIAKAYNYFISQGLKPIAAAGIVGNLMEESMGVNPKIVEAYQTHPLSYSDILPDYAHGTAGYGIAQWTSAGRQDKLIQAAVDAGQPQDKQGKQIISDLGVQLDYLWSEATGTYSEVLTRLKAATTTADAATIWMGKPGAPGFENPNPAKAQEKNRQDNAADVYARLGSNTSSSGTCTGSGNFATNFITYKQCDTYTLYSETPEEKQAAHAWSNAPYGNSTVCAAGCGPSAMAMAIVNLTGQQITPDMTAKYGFENGTASGGGKDGSNGWKLGPVIGGHWGLNSVEIPNFDIDKINETLRSGGLVLARGHMDNDSDGAKGPFSFGGHFVIIRAVTSEGKWLIGNSGGWPDKSEYDPMWVLAHTTVHNAWALTKQ